MIPILMRNNTWRPPRLHLSPSVKRVPHWRHGQPRSVPSGFINGFWQVRSTSLAFRLGRITHNYGKHGHRILWDTKAKRGKRGFFLPATGSGGTCFSPLEVGTLSSNHATDPITSCRQMSRIPAGICFLQEKKLLAKRGSHKIIVSPRGVVWRLFHTHLDKSLRRLNKSRLTQAPSSREAIGLSEAHAKHVPWKFL